MKALPDLLESIGMPANRERQGGLFRSTAGFLLWRVVVGQSESKLPVNLCAVGWVGLAQGDGDVAELLDELRDLLTAHPRGKPRFGLLEYSEGAATTGLDLGDPSRDDLGIGAGFQCCQVTGELGVTVGDCARASTRALSSG
ncbi:hypothetical protein AB0F68_30520 [Micromonospora sp. NPDC023966]|uniref:hypothetical protein n=1 Tax=Micromonospora sp. NPDC023966 TaxID=3154699 RepID=UPI0033E732FE